MAWSASHRRWALIVLALATIAFSGWVAWLSNSFAYEQPTLNRPIPQFLSWWVGSFIIQLLAVMVAVRSPSSRSQIGIIVGTSIVARIVLIPSHPIQEVDLYRYLWDGQVAHSGQSPFGIAPADILRATARGSDEARVNEIGKFASSNATVHEILCRVHYPELPTVYPPVSQWVFRLAAAITPQQASVETHVRILKILLVGFDLGILATIIWLLCMARRHPGWAIAYGWNPLVLKEFANSGHLDSIAVFFCTLAVALAMSASGARDRQSAWLGAAAALGLGVGAKLFPVVLLPVIIFACIRRQGWRWATVTCLIFLSVSFVCLQPFWTSPPQTPTTDTVSVATQTHWQAPTVEISPPLPMDELSMEIPWKTNETQIDIEPPLPPSSQSITPPDHSSQASDGLTAFLSRWQMNDVVFALIHENMRPGPTDAWYCIVDQERREQRLKRISQLANADPARVAFVLARGISLAIFALLAIFVLSRFATNQIDLPLASFYMLAWFWILSPTLNPWYWTWALPLIAFAPRSWLMVSGCLGLYYARFWINYQGISIGPYLRADAFNHVVVFIEHLPWMTAVGISALWSRAKSRTTKDISANSRS